MRPQPRLFALATVASVACAFCLTARAADSTPVSQSLSSLDAWLGQGATAEGWSSFLKLPVLRQELAKGNQADVAALRTVEKQLASNTPGLERPRFVALREALGDWINSLVIEQSPSLSQAVLNSQADFRPVSAADLAQAKAQLQGAAGKLDRYLSGTNGANWKKYLGFEELEKQLAADEPDVKTLADIYFRFTANQVGLELPVFANTADALERYINDLAAQDEKLEEQFGQQLKDLAAALEQYEKQPTIDLANDLGGRLGWLTNRRQLPGLVQAIRSQISRPNLHASVSERLISAGIAQPLDEVTPVRDYILGTSISGSGRMVGNVTAELVPSDTNAMLDALLTARVNSRTVGLNGPATIYSNGATALAGRKRIVIDANGFAVFPATAAANTNTQVTGIGGSGLVQRVASRRVGEQKGQAERIAADHAADRVRARMDDQVNRQIAEANANFQAKVRNPLLRRRELPDLSFRTTDEHLRLGALAANRNQIAAPGAPPEINAADLGLQVHESMINNLAASLLGGVTLEEEDLQKQVIEMRGSLPEALQSDEERDPWSITFARNQPVTVSFAKGLVTITVRGSRYTSGDQNFRAMNVTAVYKAEITEPNDLGLRAIRLVRQGELDIVPPGEKRTLSGREITLRTLLQKRFGKLFEPEIVYDDELVLPGKWRQAGLLNPQQLSVDQGWLAVGLLQSGVPAPPEKEKPATVPPATADNQSEAAASTGG